MMLFAGWAVMFFIVSFVLFGALGLPTDYEYPFMGVMLLLCLLSYTFALNFVLHRVWR